VATLWQLCDQIPELPYQINVRGAGCANIG
jgi:hypothetical protein